MPATFSVPARRRRSWPPPLIRARPATPSRSTSAPTPLGPPILCAESVIMSAPSAPKSSGSLAGDLNRIGMQKTARLMDDLGSFSDRLDGAGFVVGRHQRNEGPPPSEMVFRKLFLKHAEVDNAIARRPEFGSCSRDRTCLRRAPKDARPPTYSNARLRRSARQARAHSPRCRRS